MSVTTTKSSKTFTGNGVTVAFNCDFRIFASTDVTAFYVDPASGSTTPLTINTDYTISGANNDAGFLLTTIVPVPSGQNLVVRRVIPYTQPTSFTNQSRFFPVLHQDMADRLEMQIQQISDQASRALTYPDGLGGGFSGELPYPLAGNFIGWNSTGTALVNAGTSIGTALGFQQSGTGSVLRFAQDKMRERASVKDFGAAGDGVTEDGAKIAAGILAKNGIVFPAGPYKNTATALSVPFTKTVEFDPDAVLNNSGSGSFTNTGFQIRKGWNPDGMTWTNFNSKHNYAGIHVDLGNYGATSFSGLASVVGVVGAINIPTGALTGGWGIAGYAKTVAPGGPAVAVYGEGNLAADNTVCWGLNTRSLDNGFDAAQVWGAEIDLDITNVGSTVVGVDVVGGSTVEPAISIAYRVGALGTFTSPKKKWQRGFYVDDGAAFTAIEIGPLFDSGASVGCPPITMFYRNASNVRTQGIAMALDTSGIFTIDQQSGSRIDISGRNGGTLTPIISVAGNKISFFGAAPVVRSTITGSKSGNVALDSLLQELNRYGLIINSTT